MVDKLDTARRSENMRRIRSRDTLPELQVRRYLHSLGFRYRLHLRALPGAPDLVFPSARACVFVHGCFWHGCRKCVDGTRRVKSRRDYWKDKIAGNIKRDAAHFRALAAAGWKVFVVWECEIRDTRRLGLIARAIGRRAEARRRVASSPEQ